MNRNARQQCCCFTGHRPEKLHIDEENVKIKLDRSIDKAILDGYTTFIVGMCRGIDLWAGEIVIKKKANNPSLQLVAAIPHENFERPWSRKDKLLYYEVLENADTVKVISDTYFKACYQKRNIWMVDHSSRVIAAYNGERGGTKNTIDYAQRQNIEIINIL